MKNCSFVHSMSSHVLIWRIVMFSGSSLFSVILCLLFQSRRLLLIFCSIISALGAPFVVTTLCFIAAMASSRIQRRWLRFGGHGITCTGHLAATLRARCQCTSFLHYLGILIAKWGRNERKRDRFARFGCPTGRARSRFHCAFFEFAFRMRPAALTFT